MSRVELLLTRRLAAMWEQIETLDLLRNLEPTPTQEAIEEQRKRCLKEIRAARSIFKDIEGQVKFLQLPAKSPVEQEFTIGQQVRITRSETWQGDICTITKRSKRDPHMYWLKEHGWRRSDEIEPVEPV